MNYGTQHNGLQYSPLMYPPAATHHGLTHLPGTSGGLHPWHHGHHGYGEYFLTGMNGFGAVPVDQNTAAAYILIEAIDAGSDPAPVLAAMDPAARQTVCQRAIDILNLPLCTADQSGVDGSCSTASGLATPVATLKTKIAAACKAQGTSVTGAGMSTTTMLLIGAGVLAGGFLLYKVMHK